jgi:NADH-quinone oxidoreductase subunit H
VFWFMAKLLVLLFCTVWLRASLPRLRYDHLMDLGWKVLIEVAFLWIMVSGLIVIADEQGWNLWVVVPAGVVGALLVYGLLYLAMPKRDELLEDQIR